MSTSDPALPGPPSDRHFATLEGPALAAELMRRVREYQEHLVTTGKLDLMQVANAVYYGRDPANRGWTTREVVRAGKEGQLAKIKINHFGSLVRAAVVLATSQRLGYECEAAVSDSETQNATVLAGEVLDSETEALRLNAKRTTAARQALLYRASYRWVLWDALAGGEVQDPEEGDLRRDPETLEVVGVNKYGAAKVLNLTPLDVAYDYMRPDAEHEWIIGRRPVNKFNLAARYPELAGKILAVMPGDMDAIIRLGDERDKVRLATSEQIWLYEFFHLKTDAVPEGKWAAFVSSDCLLDVQEFNPLSTPGRDALPIVRLTADEEDDTPDGHSPMLDLLAPQQGVDASASMALTKERASLPKTFIDEKAQLSLHELNREHMPMLKVRGNPKDAVHVVQTTVSSEPSIAMASWLQKQMETISAINSVVRGNPEESLGKAAAGVALTFVQAQSLLQQSNFQANLQDADGEVGRLIIVAHQKFNTSPRRLQAMAGVRRSTSVSTFSGEQLKPIQTVRAKAGTALSRSMPARMQALDYLGSRGHPQDPAKVVAFLETGEWETVVEDAHNEEQQIREENERLARGEPTMPAAVGENPLKHIQAHLARSDEDKADPARLAARQAHIMSHVQAWMDTPAPLLMALGVPPLQAMMGMVPPGAPSAESGQPQGAGPPQERQPTDGGEPGGMPGLPNLPDGTPVDQSIQDASARGMPQ